MSSLTATPATPRVHAARARAARISGWAARILLSAQFVVGGALKVTGEASMVALFDDIGGGVGLQLLVGACEVVGAIGLLVARLVRPAAAGLLLLMVGAAITNVAILQTSPALPIVFGALAGVVLATTRQGDSR